MLVSSLPRTGVATPPKEVRNRFAAYAMYGPWISPVTPRNADYLASNARNGRTQYTITEIHAWERTAKQ